MTDFEIKRSKAHSETKMNIIKIFEAVRDFSAEINSYYDVVKRINESTIYTDEGKKTQIANINREYGAKAEALFGKAKAELDGIKQHEAEADKVFDITDNKLISALQIMNASNGKLSAEALNNIVSNFIGNRNGLLTLKDVFTSHGVNTQSIDKYIVDVSKIIDNVEANFDTATKSFGNAEMMYYASCKALSGLADNLGIELEGEFDNIGVSADRCENAMARAVMGLE